MMDQRRALSIPFSVDKDNLMESPLKISTICLSSECGKLDRQVSWTAFAGSKLRHRDSEHKNGSTLMDHNHETMVTQQMAMRKPCLVLTDVLKTDVGKTYMEKIKQSYTPGNRGQMSSTLKGRDRCKEDPGVCRELRSSHGEEKKNCVSSKHSQTSSSLSQRSGLRRRSQNIDYEEDKEENKDFEEKIIGKSNGENYTFAEVVDCGLSVSWEPAESTRCCDEFSPNIIKEKWTDPDKEVLRRKRNISGSLHCRTVSPKRHRKSVLRLNGEDGRDGAPGPADVCVEESEEDGDAENADRTVVQFTVGGDDGREVLFPIIAPYLEAGDTIDTQRHQESSQDSTTNTSSPTDPIVLSSDDEESDDLLPHCSPPIHTVIQEQLLQEAAIRQDDCNLQDLQVLRVVVEEHPVSVALSPIPSIDHSCMSISFSTLYCGGYQAKANGNIMMADRRIIIPLKDSTEQVELMLMLDRKALRRYSVWEEQEMEMRAIYFDSDEDPAPAAVLVFCVSETAAAEMQRDLRKLCVEQDGNMNTGTASPFILLTLRDPLEGMEGALLRSLLDIDCLNSLTHEQSLGSLGSDRFSGWEDVQTPVLCLDESIELIRKTGLDSHLLCLLGLGSPVPELNSDSSHSDTEEINTPQSCPEVEPQKETPPELETTSEEDTGTEVKPEEDQKEEVEHPSEKKEGPTPVYTLCHRRTKGSYSVSHCKPDSSWIKYKHQGLARRLIQFPPPPLKGGITVTMEDLQCLDSGQFLNDVIIDFYLKYLLHNASAAVAERSHIFSSFFYKQLTRRDNASEGATSDSCQRQRRHQRVKTWTRHVDIFKKDFLFVPVNQEAHWYLVVICFHGLNEPKFEAWPGPDSETVESHDDTEKLQDQEEAQRSKSPNENTETPPPENPSDNAAPETENTKEQSTKDPPPGPVCCTEKTFKKKVVCKRPCILIMDSLKLSLHERVFKLLREYLQSEWEVRRGSSREFGPDQMKGSHCQVPRQDNSSDCGLYLLQYVESFLKDPVVHFDIPLRLERWFPRQQVRRKRDEIRDLILNLYRWQNLDSNR